MLRNVLRLPVFLTLLLISSCAEGPAEFASPQQRVAVEKVRLDKEKARVLINQYRVDNGLSPLSFDSALTRAAQRHSADLARHDKISHTGSDGSNPWKRIHGSGYKARLAAENVGAGQRSIAEVFRGWQESPGHNKNLLLADATQMGIALVTDPQTRYGTFWTLVLGTPL